MQKLKYFFSIFAILFSFSINGVEKGPLEVKNTYPPALIFLYPTPTTPSTLKNGEFRIRGDFIQANIMQYGGEFYRTQVNMDMEVTRSAMSLQYGLTDRFEVGMELPFLYYSRGIADTLIQSYHSTFGFPSAGRDLVGNFSFKNKITDYWDTHTNTKPKSDFGDLTLNSKWKLFEENGIFPLVSLSGVIELPTGNHKYLMGNGRLDYGAGILLKKTFENFSLYGNFYAISIGETVHTQNVKVRPYIWTAVYSISYQWSEKLSILVQLNDSSSPYKSSQKNLDSFSSIFSMGLKYSIGNQTIISISFSEDFSHRTTPDVTLNFSVSHKFNWLFTNKDKKIFYF